MAFMKNKLNNHLICHLDTCIRFYAQQILQNWQFSFWKDNHLMEKHKGTILPWSLNASDLFMEVVNFPLLCRLLDPIIFFMCQVMWWITQCTWILIGLIFSFFMLKHTLHKVKYLFLIISSLKMLWKLKVHACAWCIWNGV